MRTTPLQIFYGLLAITGICVTWYYNIQPMEQSYMAGLYANPASTSFTNDLIVVVIAFLVWSFQETRKLGMPKWLWPLGFVLTFGIAAAMTVPLFLLLRERQLLKNAAP